MPQSRLNAGGVLGPRSLSKSPSVKIPGMHNPLSQRSADYQRESPGNIIPDPTGLLDLNLRLMHVQNMDSSRDASGHRAVALDTGGMPGHHSMGTGTDSARLSRADQSFNARSPSPYREAGQLPNGNGTVSPAGMPALSGFGGHNSNSVDRLAETADRLAETLPSHRAGGLGGRASITTRNAGLNMIMGSNSTSNLNDHLHTSQQLAAHGGRLTEPRGAGLQSRPQDQSQGRSTEREGLQPRHTGNF